MLLWVIIILLIIIIGMIITILREAGNSQKAIELGHLLSRLESAKIRGDEASAREVAIEIKRFLDDNNLKGGVFDRAREAIEGLL